VRRNSKSRISFKRRYRKFAWIFGSSAIVIALLYWEQAAVLYVLSTLAMCALLVVVMFSNLEARDKELHQTALESMAARDPESTRSASAKKRVA
jgi:Flp pilus assembly protein TadB